tara:strand:- start:467 stop:619 length:153 start_codon:yes stop_codon:yes gene_type:complete
MKDIQNTMLFERVNKMAQLETLATVIVYSGVVASFVGLFANIIYWNILGK